MNKGHLIKKVEKGSIAEEMEIGSLTPKILRSQ